MKTNKLNIVFLFILILVACTSCKSNEDIYDDIFVGSYSMYATIITESILGYDTLCRNVGEYPVKIYKEDDQMFVQTDIFGFPNSKSPLENSSPKRMSFHEDSTNGQIIEVVHPTNQFCFLLNGVVRAASHGMYRKPFSIIVNRVRLHYLSFFDSDQFHAALVNYNKCNSEYPVYAEADCYYHYSNLSYSKANYTWTIELKIQNTKIIDSTQVIPTRVIYHNIMYRNQ